ncbi:DUF3426 domain-containing protein [Acinetobacter sp. CFCC 10889]|uniref:DUF3426 domain-containing protein n=1 Tax=Acinetobacter sp. CFCC 10889 TaxID=1775557 RepID=UPI000DD05231|nr:DUF3426 domain-containing protein [Acinetobacter sp. CFCC 10889]
MSDKQTRCPNCLTLYKVSVMQLTVAEGRVCCPKCSAEFNALLNLVVNQNDLIETSPPRTVTQPIFQQISREELVDFKLEKQNLADFFNRKIKNSNIDLRTYLNTLKFVEDNTLNTFPSLHLATHHNHKPHTQIQKTRLYYIMWTLINIALVSILSFQVLWFNPNLLDRYPILNTVFTQTCSILRCETIDQRYKQILVKNLQVKVITINETEFSGQLLNQFSKSLELPLIKVSLYKENQQIKTFIVSSDEYLVESLTGIRRIPQNSPYTFKFTLPISKNSIDSWKLEIIHP